MGICLKLAMFVDRLLLSAWNLSASDVR